MANVDHLRSRGRRPAHTPPSPARPVRRHTSLPSHPVPVIPGYSMTHLPISPPESMPVQTVRDDHPLRSGSFNQQVSDARAAQPPQRNATGLPDPLKAAVERLSGTLLDDVKVHYHSSKPAQWKALAYTQGSSIYVGSGQERHLAHEAWHVVQQKQGRARLPQPAGKIPINDNPNLEREAELMGEKARLMTPLQTEEPRVDSRMPGTQPDLPTAAQSSQFPIQRVKIINSKTGEFYKKDTDDMTPQERLGLALELFQLQNTGELERLRNAHLDEDFSQGTLIRLAAPATQEEEEDVREEEDRGKKQKEKRKRKKSSSEKEDSSEKEADSEESESSEDDERSKKKKKKKKKDKEKEREKRKKAKKKAKKAKKKEKKKRKKEKKEKEKGGTPVFQPPPPPLAFGVPPLAGIGRARGASVPALAPVGIGGRGAGPQRRGSVIGPTMPPTARSFESAASGRIAPQDQYGFTVGQLQEKLRNAQYPPESSQRSVNDLVDGLRYGTVPITKGVHQDNHITIRDYHLYIQDPRAERWVITRITKGVH